MKSKETHLHLSRRERQIMDVMYSRGTATVQEVVLAIPDPPSYSAVRAMLRVLEEKGHVRHREEAPARADLLRRVGRAGGCGAVGHVRF